MLPVEIASIASLSRLLREVYSTLIHNYNETIEQFYKDGYLFIKTNLGISLLATLLDV